jgi:hypothetical protein
MKKRASDDGESAPPAASSPDVALIHGVTPDGGFQILRARDNRLEVGAIRPLREGVPITGEVVKLHPRQDFPALCDVEVQLAAPELANDRQVPATTTPPVANTALRSGPAQVATDQYRKNWDAIWSQSPKAKLVN